MGFNIRTDPFLLKGAILGAVLFVLAALLLFLDKPKSMIEMVFERPRIEKALRTYFAAEMSRDYGKIYRCLAPSSHYRRTHSYDDFLKDMRSNPAKIVRYEIVDIYNLRPNHDPAAYPDVERFAQAEVDVTILFTDTKTETLCNYCFTFLKEKGIWLKG